MAQAQRWKWVVPESRALNICSISRPDVALGEPRGKAVERPLTGKTCVRIDGPVFGPPISDRVLPTRRGHSVQSRHLSNSARPFIGPRTRMGIICVRIRQRIKQRTIRKRGYSMK